MTNSLVENAVVVSASWVLAVSALQVIILLAAIVELRRIRQRDQHQVHKRVLASPMAPKISVLVPAYNEEVTVRDTVQGLLALSYPNLEIVVINDGSPDNTVGVLADQFDLRAIHPVFQKLIPTKEVKDLYVSSRESRLVVVDKLNGGKADSLNAGLNVASGDLVCAIDADTLVAPDALQHLVAPFLDNASMVAVGGTVRLTNDSPVHAARVTNLVVPRRPIAAVQVVEYVRAFIVGRLGWNPLGGNLIISGAFGLFDRPSVLEAGGYQTASIGEDMELIVRLRRQAYERGAKARVEFLPDPVAWTEAPESARVLARQRNRWQRGLMDVLVRHRRMIGNPRYGSAGLLALPYFVLVEFLAPLVEIVGFVLLITGLATGVVDWSVLWLVGTSYGVGAAVTILTLTFDEIAFRSYPKFRYRVALAAYAIAEQVVYRPLTLVWRMWGIQLFLRGRTEWGQQVRRGFTPG